VPGRTVHSLHSYFLRAGTDRAPIDYRVARTRDGGRFSTRRVEAVQGGQTLFVMDCSYRMPITGFSHYRACPIPFDPDAAIDQDALAALTLANGQHFGGLLKHHYPVELRIPGVEGFLEQRAEAKRHYWLRAKGADRIADAAGQRQILAFLSDFLFAGAPLTRHTVALPGPHLFVASLDHNIWFHRDVRCDDWLLFETDGPNAENGVNLARGMIYNRAGELVASIVQEALQYPVGDAE
jgi:acyl-CoA thioesterase-2